MSGLIPARAKQSGCEGLFSFSWRKRIKETGNSLPYPVNFALAGFKPDMADGVPALRPRVREPSGVE